MGKCAIEKQQHNEPHHNPPKSLIGKVEKGSYICHLNSPKFDRHHKVLQSQRRYCQIFSTAFIQKNDKTLFYI